MEKIQFGNTDLMVSKVAMGGIPIMRLDMDSGVKVINEVLNMGINFIDTAHVYGDSEEKIGKAIKKHKRENLVLASKSPAPDKKTFLSHLDLSLKRIGVDYIDIYQMHGVSSKEIMGKVMAEDGAYYGLKEAVSSGKVRYFAFSSHSSHIAIKLIKTKKFQVVQIPFNFVDIEPEEELIPLAHKLEMGIIAMKPMGGGILQDANLAFRYLAQFKGIVPDPGVEKTEEMAEIVKIIENPRPLTSSEIEKIKKIRQDLGNQWCHKCGYCMPCKNDISISTVLSAKSIIKRTTFEAAKGFLEKPTEKAKDCTECGKCIKKCPYNLDIPVLLRENIALWENYKSKFLNNKI
jgi:predicted aldo/keto reductase-like oxidoreductase